MRIDLTLTNIFLSTREYFIKKDAYECSILDVADIFIWKHYNLLTVAKSQRIHLYFIVYPKFLE